MSDRILVFASNPGRVLRRDQGQPAAAAQPARPAFRQLVDDIYARMTARRPASRHGKAFPGTGISMVLPRVSPNVLAGLMEQVAAEPYDGQADLPPWPARCRWKSTICSRWPRPCSSCASPRWPRATPADRRRPALRRADPDGRKQLFSQHLLAYVPLAGHIKRVLDERGSHAAPASRFSDELEDHMSERPPSRP